MTRFLIALPVLLAFASPAAAQGGIEFGDDASEWSNDAECDDPRFEGEGMATTTLLDSDLGHDATDCRTAYLDERVTLRPGQSPTLAGARASQILAAAIGGQDFGDDTGTFANDGECDDPRFQGDGVTDGEGLSSHAGRDAADCRAAFEAGTVRWRSEEELEAAGFFTGVYDAIFFGDNSGDYARDGECDDPRFAGPAGPFVHFPAHELRDAADCRALYMAGEAWPARHGVDPMTARYDGVDFGDNLGEFPKDGVCDDPRFEGEDMGGTALMESDIGHDADDCLRAWMEGAITLAPAEDDSGPESETINKDE